MATYTGWIILVNVIAFVGVMLLGFFSSPVCSDTICKYLAFRPADIIQGKYLWTFVTSMFMHAGFMHLFVNMISLMFVGSFVERLIGKKRFLGLYFIGGLCAGLLAFVLSVSFSGSAWGARIFGSPLMPAVGASGALFAIAGLLAVLTPRLPVLVMFIIPMPMWMAMIVLMFVLMFDKIKFTC